MSYISKFTGKQVEDALDKANHSYVKPEFGIPKSDLNSDVQESLDKANTALQEHQSLQGYATEEYVANVIGQAITTTLNTEV